MHRWHYQRMVRLLVPMLLFLFLLCIVLASQKRAGPGLAFVEDSAYAHLAVADSLLKTQTYGFNPQEPIPVIHDALWRLAIAAVASVLPDPKTAVYLLGAVFSLVVLMTAIRLARLLFPFPPFIMYSVVLLVLTPPLLADSLAGTSVSMAGALFMLAVLLHIEGLSGRRPLLSAGTAFLVGLLMWVRIEFVLVWIVFSAHAFILSFFPGKKGTTPLYAVTRSITGLLLQALVVFPLLAWNVQVIQVPWPQIIGAPFSMDYWVSASAGGALGHYVSLFSRGVPEAYARLYAIPFLSGVFEKALTWFGVLFIAVLSVWREEERPYTVALAGLLLFPLFFALLYPYVGWDGAGILFSVMGPLCVLCASFGIFRIPFLIENLYRKWKEGIPAATGFSIWWIVMGSILLVVCLARSTVALKERKALLRERAAARQVVDDAIRQGQLDGRLYVTDRPGWLAFAHKARLVDLSGEGTPGVLACLDEQGGLDPADLGVFLAERKPDSLVLWEARNQFVETLVPCDSSAGEGESPRLCRITWP